MDGLTGNVISLYAKGMTTGDVQVHLAEIYGTEMSRDTISRITDTIVEDLLVWQNRPLDRVYPVLLIDRLIAWALRDWWRLAGTTTTSIEPGSPWPNPFVESFNGRVRDELLNVEKFAILFEA